MPSHNNLLHLTLTTIFAPLSAPELSLITIATTLTSDTSDSLTILLTSADLLEYASAPDTVWREVQQTLATIYVAASKAAYDAGRPLLDVTVVFETWCGYDLMVDRAEGWDLIMGSKEDEPYLHLLNVHRTANSLSSITVHLIDPVPPSITIPTATSTHPLAAGGSGIYDHVAVGGTFDHLHSGHKILLTMTAWLARERVVCGVTDDSMLLKKTYREYIEPTQIRVEAAERFLRTVRRGLTYEVVPISDPYGPTITDAAIQALIVSRETLKGGDAVNVERANRNLAQLDIRVIDVISPSNPSLNDAGKISTLKISSSWIRKYLWEREHPATGDA